MSRIPSTLPRRLCALQLWVALLARRCLPKALTPALVLLRSRLGRRRPGRWEAAADDMRFVLGDSVPATDLTPIVAAHLVNGSWRRETRLRPELVDSQEVVGLEHLRTALEEGKGCVLNFMHHGDFVGCFSSVARAGFPVVTVGTSAIYDLDVPIWLMAHARAVTSVAGATMIDVAGGSTAVREQLAGGAVVAIAVDPAGHTPTRLYGQDLMLSSGGLRIAKELDVPVIVMTSRRPAKRWGAASVVLSSPMYPRDFGSPEELRAAVVGMLAASVLAWPEAVDKPVVMTSAAQGPPPSSYRKSRE